MLKTSASNVGASRATEAARSLEQLAGEGYLAALPACVSNLSSSCISFSPRWGDGLLQTVS